MIPLVFHFLLSSRRFLRSALLCLCVLIPVQAAGASTEVTLTFEDTNVQTVIKKVGELTGTTFFFDPEQVKGKITILAPRKVSPESALQLLQSALALHGYALVRRAEGIWVVPAETTGRAETTIEVVPLKYAKAEEVAETLSGIAPPGVRIVPYYPTNSLIISGNPEGVEELIGILRDKEQRTEGR